MFFIVMLGVAATLAAATLPRPLGYMSLVVRSGSMEPTYPTASLVISRWVPAHEVQVGDVVMLQEKTTNAPPVMHRVHTLEEVDGQRVVETKGDANDDVDPHKFVLPARLPRAQHVLPYVGYLVAAVTTRLGWALLLVLPSTILCATILCSVWSDKERPATAPALG